ncbi:hypothetical protein COOONC_28540, partial [Cooperia oncophora]
LFHFQRRVRESVVFKKRRIVPKPANSEPSPVSGVVSEKSNRDVTPEMTTALENEPVSNIDSSSTPLVNGIINSLEEICKKAVDLQLSLDVSHQAEPEAFSWSDEMERSYVESCKKDEEEQRQQDANAANGGSGDYTTSDSPGLASQNSEVSGICH